MAEKIWASLHPFFESGPTLGRREANRQFLIALIKADFFERYHFFLPHPDDCAKLEEDLRRHFPDMLKKERFVLRLHREFAKTLQCNIYYCLHLSDPFLHFTNAICLRNFFSPRIFPVTAPTHSLSYAEYGQYFLNHIWGGITERDVVVGTSTCGQQAVLGYYACLQHSYNLNENDFKVPSVRCIPLGVNPEDMPASDEKDFLARQFRNQYCLGDKIIFLVFARISYQSKMDLLPLLRACKRAEEAGLNPGDYCLLLAGWIDENDNFGNEIQKFAANLGIHCHVVPRPDNEVRKALYAAADIFLSPSDNLQETFGLTLLEAELSGLPVVASNFDGYRDLVEDGENGFLAPTIGPVKTNDTDCLARVVPAAEYHLLFAQQCVVDVKALGDAMHRLAINKALRLQMGSAGQKRVLSGYTWQHVINRYLDLWAELNEIPCGLSDNISERPRKAVFHPAEPAYMDIFGQYYTGQVDAPDLQDRWIVSSKTGRSIYRGRDFPVIYRLIERYVDFEKLRKLLFLARHPIIFSTLRKACAQFLPPNERGDEDFLLLWALKYDLLEFCDILKMPETKRRSL